MWLMRNKGLNEYKEYLLSFDTPVDEVLPKYQMFNTCPLAAQAIKSCIYAKSREGVPSEDVAEFDGDDPYDGQRYALDTAERFFIEAVQEMEEVEKRQDITDKLNNTQDWTAFYRMHQKIEADTNDIYKPVRMFHHGSSRRH